MKIIFIIMQNSISTKSTIVKQKSTAQLQHSKSQTFLSSAVEQHKKGNFEQAINIYKKAIETNPKNYGAFYNIGVIYKDKRMYQKSIQYFQKCVQIKPDYIQAYINLGNVCKRIKDAQLAEKYYLKAIQLDGSNNGVLNNLGLLYIQISRFQGAQKVFNKLLKNNANSESALNGLGVVEKNRKDYERAAQNWQKAIQCNPKFVWPYYNISLLKISQNKFEQAAIYLQKANGLKNDDILILSTTAITLYKTNKLDQAFQILQKIQQTVGQQSPQQISQRTGHNSKNIKWIQQIIKHLMKIQKLNKVKQRMSIDEQKQLTSINDAYFNSLIEDDQKQSNHAMQDMMKKIQLLGKQVQMHHVRINKIEDDVKQIKDDIDKIKKEFQWDQKFDLLLEQSPEKADYYRSLYTIICTSIQTYRSLATGMLSKGEDMIRSKAGGFINKITKILKLGSSLPTISHFCSILCKLGEIYLQKQSEHVQTQILAVTGNLYNEKKLTRATSEAIIFLSKQSCFLKLLNGPKKQDKIWYERAISKLQNIKQKIDAKQKQLFVKATQFGGHDISQQMNMAMGHCAEIFVMMIKNEHSKAVHEAQNPLVAACQLWVKQMRKFKIIILGGGLKQGGLFSSAKGTYCVIKYGQASYQTECSKRNENIIKWNKSQFSLEKKHNIEYIEFEIYDKSLLKKDVMIGCGRLYGNKVKKGIKQSIQIMSDSTVGFIQVCIL